MKDFFEAIQDLFVDVLFALIGFVAFVYWMLQLKKFDANNEEDKSISSHSYL